MGRAVTPRLIVVIRCVSRPSPSHLCALSCWGHRPCPGRCSAGSGQFTRGIVDTSLRLGIPGPPAECGAHLTGDLGGTQSITLGATRDSTVLKTSNRSPLLAARGIARSRLAAGHARGALAPAESERLAHIARAAGEAGSRGTELRASPGGVSEAGRGERSTSGVFLPRPPATSFLGRSRHSVRSAAARRADPR